MSDSVFGFYSDRFDEDGVLVGVMRKWGESCSGPLGEPFRSELRRVLARVVKEVEDYETGKPVPEPRPTVKITVAGRSYTATEDLS